MSDSCEARILLEAEESRARRWAEILQGHDTQLWLRRGDIPAGDEPDIIVTDAPQTDTAGLGEPGVVRIGPDGPADVCLPADVGPRELQLACRLQAQIVRLRRREQAFAELHRQLSVAALTDPLTGLPNRRAWDAALAERLRAAAGGAPACGSRRLCLAILDLDFFKQINDIRGHAAGDEVLRESGRAIYDSLRQNDFVARLGGDEFGLLVWVPSEAVAAKVVERARAALPARLARIAQPHVTASAGYCLAACGPVIKPQPAVAALSGTVAMAEPSAEALYQAADAALREAKRRGRDRTIGGPV